jgi:hypothetical protein
VSLTYACQIHRPLAFHIYRTILQNRSANSESERGRSDSKPGDENGASDVDEKANKSLPLNSDVRVVDLDNGMQGLVCGGRITSYIDPHKPGRIKDRLVDCQLLDEYGATDIDDLTEGQLAEYLASKCDGYALFLQLAGT